MVKRYWLDETNVGINDVYGPAIYRSYVNTNACKGAALGATMNAYMNMGYFGTMFFRVCMTSSCRECNNRL